MAAADEIERLSAENERLHKRTAELEKRARTAERNLRHMTEAGDELRVNANEGWRQYGETAAEIERLNAENSSLRVQILVLKKSADYHKSQDCIEIQNAICRQRDELSADNARLREALEKIAKHDMQAIAMDALNPDMRVRAALAEQTGFNEPTPHKPQYPFEIKSSAAEKEKT
jgi:chromosome segregation ATPase